VSPALPRLLLLGLMTAAGILACWRGPLAAGVPGHQPAAAATPWMADCLAGVGPKRRDEVALLLRTARWDRVPPRARARAAQLFSGVPERWAEPPRH
jgi:hypothetical protein